MCVEERVGCACGDGDECVSECVCSRCTYLQ